MKHTDEQAVYHNEVVRLHPDTWKKFDLLALSERLRKHRTRLRKYEPVV